MLVRPRITEGHKLLARNIRRWRELRGISTTTLSKAVDWSLATIEDIERAERFDITLNDIDQLAEALDVQPMELFVPLGGGTGAPVVLMQR